MRRLKPLIRLCQILAVIVLFSATSPGLSGLALAQSNGTTFTYKVAFLPSTVKRLCVGDSVTFHFMVKIQDLGPLAPLTPRQISITTEHGTANPVVFSLTGGYGVFSFNYTADSPGDETVTVQMVADQGSASKSFKIFEACDYEVTFFAQTQQDTDSGGYSVAFWGAGSLGLARRNEADLTMVGDGNDAAELLMYALRQGLFTCTMTPFTGNSTFTTKGQLLPDEDEVQFAINFQPISFPTEMTANCQAKGLGTFAIKIPIGSTQGDPNDLKMDNITVDTAGGTYQFAFGSSTGVVTVRKASQ